MDATCLICHETMPSGDGTEDYAATVLVDHVLAHHRDRVTDRGPLLIEALACFGLQPHQLASMPSQLPPRRDPKMKTSTTTAAPVLVVEDNDDVRDAMLALIMSAGFRACGAENGQQALEVLRGGEKPSLIVLDLMMPVMNGIEFRHRQLADPALADIPVVVVTAYGRAADKRDFGGAEVLGKPVEIERLLDVVRQRCAQA